MITYAYHQVQKGELQIDLEESRHVVLKVKNGKAIIPSKIKGISTEELDEIGEIVMNFNHFNQTYPFQE